MVALETTRTPAGPDELRRVIAAAEKFARLDAAQGVLRAIEDGHKRALTAAKSTLGVEGVTARLIGLRTGFPSFLVSRDTPPDRLLVVTPPTEVLSGLDGWHRFRGLEAKRAAEKWASAWLVLGMNIAREPMGPWSNPPVLGPSWNDDELIFAYEDEAGRRRRIGVRFRDGAAPAVRDLAWVDR